MITIVPAASSDYPTIQRIAHQTWPETFKDILSSEQINYMLDWMYSLPALHEQVEKKGHRFLIAREEQDFVGFLSYEAYYQEKPKTKIHKIYILPTTQGKGVGKVLINHTAEIAQKNGDSSLILNVNRNNKALNFYKKMGFETMGQEDIDIGNGFLMEDYILEKQLT